MAALIRNALRQIDVQDMLVFVTILSCESARETADVLGLSPSTISYSLKRLRECFDDELFLVRKGAMSPTPKAEAIAPYVQAAIDSINRCAAPEDALLAEMRRRTFRTQAPEYYELLLLPRIVETVAAPFGVTLETERLGAELPVERLLAGKLDLAFGFGPGYHRIHPELEWRSVLDEDFVCLTSVSSLRGKKISLDEFLTHPHVHPTPWDATTNMVDGWLDTIGRQRRIIARANTYQACLNIIEKTPLLFSLPRRLFPLLKIPESAHVFEPPMGFPTFTLDVIWSKRRADESRWLREQLARVIDSMLAFPAPT
ncbi:hypothetical protein BJF93_23310 [Xaviernesmea oryzae]|uniref:HTH lysR-type domain-containing protein n=1 Tax=Xaviernesmea oryzae TaxID=464029 RepID=A0A1Q9AU64_9HYPH|nr:LysR family transcriptional regulator [Xaviernesmea oryzae]OLP58950.1 hypothetical protein BJF93_23310 [Xaviernesmea oryzae]SEM00764.1 DNA-binding transcriptional regulator, LysR family [Xaviernesmea oryzae]